MNTAYLLLGTNLGNKEQNIANAQTEIALLGRITAHSKNLENEAIGFIAPPFLNKIIVLETTLSPFELLDCLQEIEKKLGRNHKTQIINGVPLYQNRIIDIDILTFNQEVIHSERLKLPHHQIESRPFVKQLLANLL